MRVCVCVNTLTVSIVIYCKVWRNLHDMTLMRIMMLLGTSFIKHMENQMKGLESDIENIRIPWRVDGLGVQKSQVVEELQQMFSLLCPSTNQAACWSNDGGNARDINGSLIWNE